MTTVTKTFSFTSNAEGLVYEGAGTGKVTFAYEGADGNPAGSVYFYIDGRNTADFDYANTSAQANTWESWGVPAGATVNSIRVLDWEKKLTAYNTVDVSPNFTIQVRDNTGNNNVGTGILTQTSVGTSIDANFVSQGASLSQNVQSSYQSSTTGIHLRLGYINGDLGNSATAALHTLFDNISIEIDYTAGSTDQIGSVVFETSLDSIHNGSRLFNGNTEFSATLTQYSNGSKNIDSDVTFDIGMNSISRGTNVLDGASSLTHNLLFNAKDSRFLDSALSLQHTYNSILTGSKVLDNTLNLETATNLLSSAQKSIDNSIVFDLNTNYVSSITKILSGSFSIATNLALSSIGSRILNSSVQIQNIYNGSWFGSKALSGVLDLSSVIGLFGGATKSTIGMCSLDIDFDLIGASIIDAPVVSVAHKVIPRRKLLLMLNSFDNTVSVVRKAKIEIVPGGNVFANAVFKILNILSNTGNLIFDKRTSLNNSIHTNYNAVCDFDTKTKLEILTTLLTYGGRYIDSTVEFNNGVDTIFTGVRLLNSSSSLTNSLVLSSFGDRLFDQKTNLSISNTGNYQPSLVISGNNSSLVDINIECDGDLFGQTFASTAISIVTQLLARGVLNLSNASSFTNTYNTSYVGSKYLAGKTELYNRVNISSSGSRTFNGKTSLNNTHTVVTVPSLNITGSSINNIVFVCNSKASVDLAGRTTLNSPFYTSYTPSLSLVGRAGNSVVINLVGDGATASDEFGYTSLSSIISLLCKANVDVSPALNLVNNYILGNTGKLDINSSVFMENSCNLVPFGVLYIGGSVGKTLVIDLTSDGRTFADAIASTVYSIVTNLGAVGSLSVGPSTTLLNRFGLSTLYNLDIGGSSRLNTNINMDAVLSSIFSGGINFNFDISTIANLTSISESVKQLLFDLCVLRNYGMCLNITKNNSFDLKIKDASLFNSAIYKAREFDLNITKNKRV